MDNATKLISFIGMLHTILERITIFHRTLLQRVSYLVTKKRYGVSIYTFITPDTTLL